MASTPSRKGTRSRAATRARGENNARITERYLVDAHGKRVAVVLELEEYRRLMARSHEPPQTSAELRAKLVESARRAEGSWKENEASGTAVEIVRRLRAEWER
ncbi:MAG: hypothetical protein KGJ80_03335 [Chloroflexota bacterium]|nr:hypothetical protein [Chloroflexota bacterium]